MNSWHSYPKVYAIGHAALRDLFNGEVVVQEKIDGSQFSFGITEDGELKVKSKNCEFPIDGNNKMFELACETVARLKNELRPGWTYRGEFLMKPKHNTLAYGRVPAQNIILFDIETGLSAFLPIEELAHEASRLGLEVVPTVYVGEVNTCSQIFEMVKAASVLDGVEREGVVVKNYAQFGSDKKVLMGKYVREDFKEKNSKNWKQANPNATDVIIRLQEEYRTEARWDKAIQHKRDAGLLENSPRDIGILLKEIGSDVMDECEEEMKEAVWKWARPKVMRGLAAGFAEYYKAKLAGGAFE